MRKGLASKVIQGNAMWWGEVGWIELRLFHTRAWWQHALRVKVTIVSHDSNGDTCNPNRRATFFFNRMFLILLYMLVTTPKGNISARIHAGGYFSQYFCLKWRMNFSRECLISDSIISKVCLNLLTSLKLSWFVIQKGSSVTSHPYPTIALLTATSIFSISLKKKLAIVCQIDTASWLDWTMRCLCSGALFSVSATVGTYMQKADSSRCSGYSKPHQRHLLLANLLIVKALQALLVYYTFCWMVFLPPYTIICFQLKKTTRTFEHRWEAWRVLGLQKYTFFLIVQQLFEFFLKIFFLLIIQPGRWKDPLGGDASQRRTAHAVGCAGARGSSPRKSRSRRGTGYSW